TLLPLVILSAAKNPSPLLTLLPLVILSAAKNPSPLLTLLPLVILSAAKNPSEKRTKDRLFLPQNGIQNDTRSLDVPKRKPPSPTQTELLDITARLRTGPCVPALREAVKAWKAGGYKGITDTTRIL